ncbi:MAG: GWxTD domain-containing protein [Longimicrobiales bacterium]
MTGIAAAASEGRLRGGPFRFAPVSLLTCVFACGGGPQDPGQPSPDDETGAVGRPLATYQQMGFLAGPGFFPAVASFTSMAGPSDSALVLFGLSLPNSALRFNRGETGFQAEYTVTLTFTQDSQVVSRVRRSETIHIPTFAETGRTDESIVFQQVVTLSPGRYDVAVEAGDANSSRGFRVQDTLDVPAYGARQQRFSTPVVIYEGEGRSSRDSVPRLILNPRHTIAYGGEAPRVYLETYGAQQPEPVRLTILDEADNVVWSARTTIAAGDAALRRALVDLPAGTLPLGKMWVAVSPQADSTGPGMTVGSPPRAPLVISISDQWMVANFEEVIDFLEYIGTPEEIDSLRNGEPSDRKQLWDDFWLRRDPIPATPLNEYRDAFFERVRYATEQFGEAGGQPGWRTDRGEVYIVLGPPAFSQERYIGRDEYIGRPNAIEWLYENLPGGRVSLLFIDRNSFGRYELAPASEAAFRAVADRMKSRPSG